MPVPIWFQYIIFMCKSHMAKLEYASEEKKPRKRLGPDGQPDKRGPQINDPHADEGVQQGYGNDTKGNHPFSLFPPRGRVGQEPRYRHDDFLSSVHLNPTSFKFVLPG